MNSPDFHSMSGFLRCVSAVLFISAIIAVLAVLAADMASALALTPVHRAAGALSFVLIGGSYVALQLSLPQSWTKKVKPLLLGVGFLFWGSAKLLPSGVWVTAMDTAVVFIFVMDLSLIILEHLKVKNHE